MEHTRIAQSAVRIIDNIYFMGDGMKRHNLKVLTPYFEAQIQGSKTFEFRKNDRDFKIGDEIKLNEISAKLGDAYKPTGRACIVEITYILSSSHGNEFEGIAPGYCVMSTRLVYS